MLATSRRRHKALRNEPESVAFVADSLGGELRSNSPRQEAEKGSFRNVLNKFIISNILLPVIATVDDMIHSIGSFNS